MYRVSSHSESLRIKLDNRRDVTIRISRDKEVILSVYALDIDYSYGGVLIDNQARYLWHVGLHGWYPLDKLEKVCDCSPGVHKTRQGHKESYRSEWERDVLSCPYWGREIVVQHSPAWFTFESQIVL